MRRSASSWCGTASRWASAASSPTSRLPPSQWIAPRTSTLAGSAFAGHTCGPTTQGSDRAASLWRFRGDPDDLLRRYEALLTDVPAENMRLHLCLRADDGIV